jgi:hypothetical protein
MRPGLVLSIVAIAGILHAQEGQSGARPGWPCVPGRAVDPAYLDLSESSGGQLFLLQKNEVAQTSLVMNASYTHPATVLRAIGNLNGTRDFEFPVDAGIASILLLVSLQCRNAILLSRPSGAELTAVNSALSVDLQAGRILRIDQPEAGQWRVRLAGSGLFVLSVLAKADIALTGVTFSIAHDTPARIPILGVKQDVQIQLAGDASDVRVQLVDATGGPLSGMRPLERIAEGVYRTSLTPQVERFRLRMSGTAASAQPFERMYPVLFRALPPK